MIDSLDPFQKQLKIPRHPRSQTADHYLIISIDVDFSLHRLTFLTIPGESKKIFSKIHAGSEGFSESMDRYVKPHGGLRIANYGDVVTFLGYGKVWGGWDGDFTFGGSKFLQTIWD